MLVTHFHAFANFHIFEIISSTVEPKTPNLVKTRTIQFLELALFDTFSGFRLICPC